LNSVKEAIMDSTKMVTELREKSRKADEMIEKLRAQIEQIKIQTTPAYMASRVGELKGENEKLKERVEVLKKELETAEAAQPAKPVATAAAAPVVGKQEQPKKEPKAEKKPAEPKKEQQKEPPKPAEPVDVSKLDIRVGKIVECAKHPEADALYVEKIDLGEAAPRNVCSGLVKFIPLEQMQDQMVVVLCNLKPTKLRGVLSEAMVLCASTPEAVELMKPPAGAAVGERVTAAGFEGAPAPECNPKNNIFGLVQPDLSTNDQLVGTYKGLPLEVKGKGPIVSSTLKRVPIK